MWMATGVNGVSGHNVQFLAALELRPGPESVTTHLQLETVPTALKMAAHVMT